MHLMKLKITWLQLMNSLNQNPAAPGKKMWTPLTNQNPMERKLPERIQPHRR
uniref:Uncharacterized protein n=1 Tax=Arundo donax TaxID=35708 RepID=A0A0A9FQL6_ARUDO